jgi:hypothetical protein
MYFALWYRLCDFLCVCLVLLGLAGTGSVEISDLLRYKHTIAVLCSVCERLKHSLDSNLATTQIVEPLLHMCSVAPVEEFASMVSKMRRCISTFRDAATRRARTAPEELQPEITLVNTMTKMMQLLQEKVKNMQRQSRDDALVQFVAAGNEAMHANWVEGVVEEFKTRCKKRIQRIEENGTPFSPEEIERERDPDVTEVLTLIFPPHENMHTTDSRKHSHTTQGSCHTPSVGTLTNTSLDPLGGFVADWACKYSF